MDPAALLAPAAANVREVAADAALVLMLGGLAMVLLVTLLVLLQNLAPMRAQRRLGAPAPGRELRPVENAPAVPAPGARLKDRAASPYATPPVDRVLDAVVGLGLGEPRLLRALHERTHLRLYRCRGCRDLAPDALPGGGCHAEAQALAELLGHLHGQRIAVVESRCRRRGHLVCEFEVAH